MYSERVCESFFCLKAEVCPKSSILLHSETVFLSGEQKRVIKSVMDKKNIFFTGSAGTGKSLVLKRLIGSLPHETSFITAATGTPPFLFLISSGGSQLVCRLLNVLTFFRK